MSRGGLFGLRGGEYRVRVAAPHGATVRALASADISGRGRYADVDVKVASGDVEFEDVSGEADVNTASGDVQLDRVGTAKVNSASGDVQIDESANGADVNTASGDVELRSVAAGEVRINSASGDIEVGIAEVAAVGRRADTLWRHLVRARPRVRQHDRDRRRSLVELKARSMSGDISVKRA